MDRVVLVDAGHGGTAPAGLSSPGGVRGPGGLFEKDVALALARRVAARLGRRAILSRTRDVNLSLAARQKLAREAGAHALVSLHANRGARGQRGAQVWTHARAGGSSRLLGGALARRLGRFGGPAVALCAGDLALLRPDALGGDTAGCLVEIDFLSDPDAERMLGDAGHLDALGDALAGGIDDFLVDGGRWGAPMGIFAYYQPSRPARRPRPLERAQSGPGAQLFLPGNGAGGYADYVRPATTGLLEPLINGRAVIGGSNVDLTEPLDRMEECVRSLGDGDVVYLAAWFFEPGTPLTLGTYNGVSDWGNLFAQKAAEGVKIRILINDFDPISGMDSWLAKNGLDPLDAVIGGMSSGDRDNLKYVVSMHPARVDRIASAAAGAGWRQIAPGSHHQKFMVVLRGGDDDSAETIAFLGGLDIESRKVPLMWRDGLDGGWHDVHLKATGLIAKDVEREFVMRWNREKDASTRAPISDWAAMETLTLSGTTAADSSSSRATHKVQMLRTVSHDGTVAPYSNDRDDVQKVYGNAVQLAKKYLYLENQYFRAPKLAEWLAGQAKAQPQLVCILVVVEDASADDKQNTVTAHGDYLQFQFFKQVLDAFGKRARLYTMKQRAVHAKLLLADDRYMHVGSANANVRSFEMDTELNVAVDDTDLVSAFRKRLWAHNLAIDAASVGGWAASDFLARWDAVAKANAARPFEQMVGEAIVPYDYTTHPGDKSWFLPDAIAKLDLEPQSETFAGFLPSSDEGGDTQVA